MPDLDHHACSEHETGPDTPTTTTTTRQKIVVTVTSSHRQERLNIAAPFANPGEWCDWVTAVMVLFFTRKRFCCHATRVSTSACAPNIYHAHCNNIPLVCGPMWLFWPKVLGREQNTSLYTFWREPTSRFQSIDHLLTPREMSETPLMTYMRMYPVVSQRNGHKRCRSTQKTQIMILDTIDSRGRCRLTIRLAHTCVMRIKSKHALASDTVSKMTTRLCTHVMHC